MASVVTEIAAALLVFTCVVQGARSLQIEQLESLNAAVGQNISLPCILAERRKVNINQIEWDIKTEDGRRKLVVYNPLYPTHYFVPNWVELELVHRSNSTSLQGSILHLYNVTENNTGTYICDITTFPDGSSQNSTVVHVTEPWISARVESPGESLIEGDEVNVTCVSHPPAHRYILSPVQSGLLLLESESGHFTIQNVTRHSRRLTCRPSDPHLHGLRANLRVTVNFIDSIKCNSGSQVEVETGTNLTITCKATSSTPLSYTWMKGNETVSQNATISVWSVAPDHAGMYSVTVYARNHRRLQRRRDFEVTVLGRADAEHLSSTTAMETTSQVTDATPLTTAGTETTAVTVTPPGHTSSTAYTTTTTTTETSLYYYTTTPSAGNITTVQAEITTAGANITTAPGNITLAWSIPPNTPAGGVPPSEDCCLGQNTTSSLTSTREEFPQPRPVTSTAGYTPTATLITVKTMAEQSGSKVAAFLLVPILLLVVLIGFLYRRYHIRKRMDMPPPFKPPPPPVKYTSVRSQEIPVTDILV